MRRITALWVAMLAGATLFTGLGSAPTTAQAKTTKPTPISVSPTTPTQGQPFTISGKIGTKVKRPVTAQYKTGTTWKTLVSGKTTSKGAYQLSVTTSASSLVVRVVAKKVKIKHKTYKKVTTKTRTITTSAPTPAPTTTLVSRTVGTPGGNADSASLSADGRFVQFTSMSNNLVPGDTNAHSDVFVRDRSTGSVSRVSVSVGGAQATGGSFGGNISADGRYSVFLSDAVDLVPNDTNSATDVFVHDRQNNTTVRVSVATNGTQANADSYSPVISGDGHRVAFASGASNLVPGSGTNRNVFVHDLVANTTTLASVAVGGAANASSVWPSISADGRYVAFASNANNLVAGDSDGLTDVFVRDLASASTSMVSVSSSGVPGDNYSTKPSISADGRYVAFESGATNLIAGDTNGFSDVFVRDRVTNTTTRESLAPGGGQPNGGSYSVAISADGHYLTFESYATSLVTGDTNGFSDVFVCDRASGTTTRASISTNGTQGDSNAASPAISADGTVVAFTSDATSLISGDTDTHLNVFVRAPLH